MSLINQMLRDLDARHAIDAEQPGPVRVLAAGNGNGAKMVRWLTLGLLLLAVVVAVALGLDVWRSDRSTATDAPAPGAPAATLDSPSSTPADAQETALLAALPTLADVQQAGHLELRLDQTLRLSSVPTAATGRQAIVGVPATRKDTHVDDMESQKIAVPAAVSREDDRADRRSATGSQPAVKIEKTERSEPGAEMLRTAIQLHKQGRTNEAINRLQQALRETPRQAVLRQTLLNIYVEQGRLEEALALLQAGLDLQPERADWAMVAARIQVERGRPAEAWNTLQQYQAGATKNADYQGFAAVLLQHLKKSHEAAQYYQAALRLKPQEARWWYALGTVLEADNQVQEAREAYQHAQAIGGLPASMAEALARKLSP
ncbi:MAG: tetratricopeptide repeat protein [Sterolibacterium sp.]|nr:tetratricopeptide repeat protein [Sterolibacterium sp.]